MKIMKRIIKIIFSHCDLISVQMAPFWEFRPIPGPLQFLCNGPCAGLKWLWEWFTTIFETTICLPLIVFVGSPKPPKLFLNIFQKVLQGLINDIFWQNRLQIKDILILPKEVRKYQKMTQVSFFYVWGPTGPQ